MKKLVFFSQLLARSWFWWLFSSFQISSQLLFEKDSTFAGFNLSGFEFCWFQLFGDLPLQGLLLAGFHVCWVQVCCVWFLLDSTFCWVQALLLDSTFAGHSFCWIQLLLDSPWLDSTFAGFKFAGFKFCWVQSFSCVMYALLLGSSFAGCKLVVVVKLLVLNFVGFNLSWIQRLLDSFCWIQLLLDSTFCWMHFDDNHHFSSSRGSLS